MNTPRLPSSCAILAGMMVILAGSAGAQMRHHVGCYHPGTEYTPSKEIPASAKTVKRYGLKSGITFNLSFADAGTGVGFDDPTLGATRLATVNSVISYLDSILYHPGGRCDILFERSQTDATGFLAFATPLFLFQPGFAPGAAHTHITTGTDILPSQPDMSITFDFGYQWNNDLGSPEFNEFDLFTVTLHELVHGLGLISVTNAQGQSTVSPGLFSTFDERLHTVNPFQRLWNANGQIQSVPALSGGPNSVVFVGNEVNAVLGSNPFIFAQDDFEENLFQQGVSITHWQLPAPGQPLPLMAPIFFSGDEVRALLPFELAALRDLGYRTGPVNPELTPDLAGPLLEGTPPSPTSDKNGDAIVDAADIIAPSAKSAPNQGS